MGLKLGHGWSSTVDIDRYTQYYPEIAIFIVEHANKAINPANFEGTQSTNGSPFQAPEMGSVWANRAQCWLKLGDHEKAGSDPKRIGWDIFEDMDIF